MTYSPQDLHHSKMKHNISSGLEYLSDPLGFLLLINILGSSLVLSFLFSHPVFSLRKCLDRLFPFVWHSMLSLYLVPFSYQNSTFSPKSFSEPSSRKNMRKKRRTKAFEWSHADEIPFHGTITCILDEAHSQGSPYYAKANATNNTILLYSCQKHDSET